MAAMSLSSTPSDAFAVQSFKLFLHGYEVMADIGIHDFEIGVQQRVSVDVEMTIGLTLENHHDKIKTTVDYDFVRSGIAKLVASRRFNTQETLCLSILQLVFEEPHIVSAVVRTRKLHVYPDAQAVGCELSARRPAL
jgi:dihydroneopterin aldolase